MTKIYVYLDESGSIHKNSSTKYFAVGGYFVEKSDKNKITSLYKKINKRIKDENGINLEKEIKSFDLKDEDKIDIFSNIQNINTFYGCAKIFDKCSMSKQIVKSNIFFNYAVKILFEDCIIPNVDDDLVEYIVSIDNRNVGVKELKDLETYLKTEFCLNNYDFKVTYYDSSTNYGIQLADLIVNTFYNLYKDKIIVEKVVSVLKDEKYKISVFPKKKGIRQKKNSII